jgi:hypothetical protein
VAPLRCRHADVFIGDEWLPFCSDPSILKDMPSQCGEEHFQDLIDHRYDQSVRTNPIIKHGTSCPGRQEAAHAVQQRHQLDDTATAGPSETYVDNSG